MEQVKSKFYIYISYFFYLIILGQSCSGLSSKPQFISFKIPSLKVPDLVAIDSIKLTANESKMPSEDLYREKPSKNKAIETKKEQVRTRVVNQKYTTAVIKKEIKIQSVESTKGEDAKSLTIKRVRTDERSLSLNMHIDHNGFEISKPKVVSMSETYNDYLNNVSKKLAMIEEEAKKEKTLLAKYNPNSKEAIDNFELEQVEDIVKIVESSVSNKSDDEIIFIDYSKRNKETKKIERKVSFKEQKINKEAVSAQPVSLAMETAMNSLEEVSKADISNRVTNVIKREMDGETSRNSGQANSYTDLLKKFNRESPVSLAMQKVDKDFDEESKMTIHALHAEIDESMDENIHGFSMYVAADNNKVYDDLNEGKIKFDYSLNGYSGLLRATVVKNFYLRTTIEVPLTGEYSNIEVPLIDIKSIENYIDKNELSGYGGYYLVDLGEYFEDVEISSDQNTQYSYEQRIFLDENFKIVKSGKDYRYILFLGVIPGNISVQYLGINRSESSKITFVAPDELTFDVAVSQPAHDINFDLTLKNTLGVQNVPLDLDTEKMKTFVGNMSPTKISSSKYLLNIPWTTKGSRTYVEVAHLDSPMFVGIDESKKIELPSIEFVHEILRSLSIEELHSNECLVHLNFDNKEVIDVKVRGESVQGPMTFEQVYLDKDGVFTKYVSPMSNKLFLLGNEEGIFPIKIEYANGKKDYLRTYCSPGTYLIEQM